MRTIIYSMWLLPMLALFAKAQGDFDPYSPGPHEIMREFFNISTFEDLPTHLDVWAPVENGTYPVVYFIGGYGGSMPGEVYEIVFERLASHGVTIIFPWKPRQDLSVDEKLPFFQLIMDWSEANLQQILYDDMVVDAGQIIDFDTAIGLGHSAGAHIICSYLRTTCGKFKGLAYLSPVDGADPWGIQDDFCTHPGEELNFDIPTLVMPAGLDAVPGLLLVPCAPAPLSNDRFYDATNSNSPKWMINSTEFGHVDFMDPFFQDVAEMLHFCAVNEEAGLIYYSTYRSYVAGQLAAFINGLLAEDCSPYFKYLEDDSLHGVITNGVYSPYETCPKPYCNWSETN